MPLPLHSHPHKSETGSDLPHSALSMPLHIVQTNSSHLSCLCCWPLWSEQAVQGSHAFMPVSQPARVPGAAHPVLNRFLNCLETSENKAASKRSAIHSNPAINIDRASHYSLMHSVSWKSLLESCLIYNHVLHASLVNLKSKSMFLD